MPSKWPVVHLRLEPHQVEKIERYRVAHGLLSQAAALRSLVEHAPEHDPEQAPEKIPEKSRNRG